MAVSLRDFETGTIPSSFNHRDHVRLAYELVARDPFDVALARFAGGLRAITAASGDAAKLHITVTVAFLAAIAERQVREPAATWDEFIARNPDLLDRKFIRRWYPAGELETETARRTFLLPSP